MEMTFHSPVRLLIVAECAHYRQGEAVLAPRHFVREIELWAQMFDRVWLATRFPPGPVPEDAAPYRSPNLGFWVANGAFTRSVEDRIRSLGRSAVALCRLIRAFRQCRFVHIRAPARNALFALLLQYVFKRPAYIKWAGNWDLSGGAPWSSRLQKFLIRHCPGLVLVTVYHRLPGDSEWIVGTATTSLTRREIESLPSIAREPPRGDGIQLLWVGRFSANKRVGELVAVLPRILRVHPRAELHLVGDGELRPAIESVIKRNKLEEHVRLHGRLPWSALGRRYAQADLLLLPSATEGFPKVLHEAMLFGVPPVVFAVGALPEIVAGRGLVVTPPGDMDAFAAAVENLLQDGERWRGYSSAGMQWARSISIESVVERYRQLCQQRWGVQLRAVRAEDERVSGPLEI